MSSADRLRVPKGVWVLIAALLAAALFAGLVLVVMPAGGRRDYILVYYAPIGVPFIAWLFERFERRAENTRGRLLLDLPIVVLSLVRSVDYTLLPLFSGHALFLTYAFVTSRSRHQRARHARGRSLQDCDSARSIVRRRPGVRSCRRMALSCPRASNNAARHGPFILTSADAVVYIALRASKTQFFYTEI